MGTLVSMTSYERSQLLIGVTLAGGGIAAMLVSFWAMWKGTPW